jgi:DHA1 family inner membrane transport protein
MPALLYFFAFCNLVIGSSAFVLGGILEPVSQALDVSLAATGQAMTAYALSTAILAPLIIMATIRWSRHAGIALALTLFSLGCLISALAQSLVWLIAGRIVMGAGAMFSAVASATAVGLVVPALRGRALSLTNVGQGISYAIGVPMGTWLGLEFGWRLPLWLATGASLAILLLAWSWVPRQLRDSPPTGSLRAAIGQWAVLRVWARTLLLFLAIFAVFTYIGPVLVALDDLSPVGLAAVLAIFGLAGVVGTLVGGWANDRFGSIRVITYQLTVVGLMMVLLPFTQGKVVLTVLTLVIWGLHSFGTMVPQQSRLVALASSQAPMLMSLNSSMLYIGSALGAVVGGLAMSTIGVGRLSWVGAPFVLLSLLTLVPDWAMERKGYRQP